MKILVLIVLHKLIKPGGACFPCTCFDKSATCSGRHIVRLPDNKELLDIHYINIFDTLIRNITALRDLENIRFLRIERNIFLNCQQVIDVAKKINAKILGDCFIFSTLGISIRKTFTTSLTERTTTQFTDKSDGYVYNKIEAPLRPLRPQTKSIVKLL